MKGPNTNAHKEERAVEQGHAVESADDQELGSGEQHAPILQIIEREAVENNM